MGDPTELLVGLHLWTAKGARDGSLGTDQAAIVHLAWVVIDVDAKQVIAIHHSNVRPEDNVDKIDWEVLQSLGFEQAQLLQAPTLAQVIQQFDAYLTNQRPDRLAFAADGPQPIRQVLYPEAVKHELVLPTYYTRYVDLRLALLKARPQLAEVATGQTPIQEMMQTLDIKPSENKVEFMRPIDDLKMTLLLAVDMGVKSDCAEDVILHLRPSIVERDECIDTESIVRVRGLQWQAADTDVAKFFAGLNIAPGGVALCLSNVGRRNGESLVRFESKEQRDMALKRHRHYMGARYLEIYKATAENFKSVTTGNNNEVTDFLRQGCQVVMRMRGLPYDCTPHQILDFFRSNEGAPSGEDRSCEVQDGEAGIMFVMRADGRATGDAFVRFNTEQDAVKALSKHKQSIGSRYIELFRSTVAEVQQVVQKAMEQTTPRQSTSQAGAQALIGNAQSTLMPNGIAFDAAQASLSLPLSMPSVSLPNLLQPQQHQMLQAQPMPSQQHVITGNRKDCIRLRGLPFEAQVHHVLDFLGEFAKFIVFQGVHMVYNAQGHPSGEAFIQMESESAAQNTALDRHNKYMQIGKKLRYIEVFQCSADDMSLTLATPIAAPSGPQLSMPSLLPHVTMPQMSMQQRIPVSPASVANGAIVTSANGRYPWPYPSPPVSPSNPLYAYAMLQQQQIQAALLAQQQAAIALQLQQQQMQQPPPQLMAQNGYYQSPPFPYANGAIGNASSPSVVIMRGLHNNTSTSDIIAFLQGTVEVSPECVQIQRTQLGPTGEAFITVGSRADAERLVLEKNHHSLNQCLIELFIYA